MLAPSTPLFLFVLTEPACPKAHGNQTPAVNIINSFARFMLGRLYRLSSVTCPNNFQYVYDV